MKKEYVRADIEVIIIDLQDVIATSPGDDDLPDDPWE